MTLIVGILCSDGAVVASDSFATYSDGVAFTIGQQQVQKVFKLGDGAIYASTGAIGIAQIVGAAIGEMESKKAFSKPPIADAASPSIAAMKAIADEIRKQVMPTLQAASVTVPLVGMQQASATATAKSIVAVAVAKRACLFQFDHCGAPEETQQKLPFIALGSGQSIADPFLALLKRVLWIDRVPTVAEGRLAAAWTIQHVCNTSFGGVGPPMQLATLAIRSDGRPTVDFGDPAEHLQHVEGAERSLHEHMLRLGQDGDGRTQDVPAPPSPPDKK